MSTRRRDRHHVSSAVPHPWPWEDIDGAEDADFDDTPDSSLPLLARDLVANRGPLLLNDELWDEEREPRRQESLDSPDVGDATATVEHTASRAGTTERPEAEPAQYEAPTSAPTMEGAAAAPAAVDDGEHEQLPDFLPELPPIGAQPTPPGVTRADSGEFYVATAEVVGLKAPATRSLLNEQTERSDELQPLVSAFAGLRAGERARVSFVARNNPSFHHAEMAELAAQDMGVAAPRASTKLWWLARAAWGLTLGENGVPERPWKSAGKKPAKDLNERDYLAQGAAKARAEAHLDVDVRVAVFGRSGHREHVDKVLLDATDAGFRKFRTHHQELLWERCDERLATSGLMWSVRGRQGRNAVVLSPAELGAMARLADEDVRAEGVDVRRSALLPLRPERFDPVANPLAPPTGLIPYAVLYKGSDEEAVAGLQADRLDSHMFVQGKAGSGKTELLKWLALGIVRNGEPLVVIDPHGEFAGELVAALSVYARDRLDDLVYVDLSDKRTAPSINPLDVTSAEQVPEAVANVMAQLDGHLAINTTTMPRGARFIELVLTALAEANTHITSADAKLTILNVSDFLRDEELRQAVTRFSTDMDVLDMFRIGGEWDTKLTPKEQAAITAPILPKFASLAKGVTGSVFSASQDKLDWAGLVAQNKVVVVNLAQMDGPQAALGAFVGSFILPALWAGQHRFRRVKHAVTGENIGGAGVRVIIDEAPAIMRDAALLPTITAEARKANFGLITACQFPRQFSPEVLAGLMANTSTKISLSLGAKEAAPFAEEVSHDTVAITPRNIASLENFMGYAQVKEVLPDGKMRSTKPFAVHTLPPLERFDLKWRALDQDERTRRVEWTEHQVDNVRERSRGLIGEPADIRRKRLALVPGSVDSGVPRRLMTAKSIKALREAAQHLSAEEHKARMQLVEEHGARLDAEMAEFDMRGGSETDLGLDQRAAFNGWGGGDDEWGEPQ